MFELRERNITYRLTRSTHYFLLQYFDTVGWVFWPVKTVSHITYMCWWGRKTLHNPIQPLFRVFSQFSVLLLTI